jgi:hypothetical protein
MEVKLYNDNKIWYYRVKREDERLSNKDFFKKFNFKEEDFIDLNPDFEKLIAGRVLIMPPSSKYYHIVAPLENYEAIAKAYNCSVDLIRQINKTSVLFIGQKIFL